MTVAAVEAILVARRKAYMTLAGMSTVSDGSNADLADPIGWAVTRLGVTPGDYTAVTDDEIDSAGGDMVVADVAEYRLLQNIKGNLLAVDVTAGPLSEKMSALLDAIDRDLSRLYRMIEEHIGEGIYVSSGCVQLDINEKDDGDA